MAKGFRHVDDTERRLVRNMAKEGIPWVTIQRITGRSPETIRSMLNPAATTVPKGAPITPSATAKMQRRVTLGLFLVPEHISVILWCHIA